MPGFVAFGAKNDVGYAYDIVDNGVLNVDVVVLLVLILVKLPVPGVVPPIAPGTANVAPFSVLAFKFGMFVLLATVNGAVPFVTLKLVPDPNVFVPVILVNPPDPKVANPVTPRVLLNVADVPVIAPIVVAPNVVAPAVLVNPPESVVNPVTPNVVEYVADVPVIAPIVVAPSVVVPAVLVNPPAPKVGPELNTTLPVPVVDVHVFGELDPPPLVNI
jgi:hypothetical protein